MLKELDDLATWQTSLFSLYHQCQSKHLLLTFGIADNLILPLLPVEGCLDYTRYPLDCAECLTGNHEDCSVLFNRNWQGFCQCHCRDSHT